MVRNIGETACFGCPVAVDQKVILAATLRRIFLPQIAKRGNMAL
jgi:hypothetical protein